jgi:hypothetical protein
MAFETSQKENPEQSPDVTKPKRKNYFFPTLRFLSLKLAMAFSIKLDTAIVWGGVHKFRFSISLTPPSGWK